jgi:hypothetical protein
MESEDLSWTKIKPEYFLWGQLKSDQMEEEQIEEEQMKSDQIEEETIEVLYNSVYGGWTPSETAVELYNDLMQKKDHQFKRIKYNDIFRYEMYDILKRDDPTLVEVFHILGSKFDSDKSISKTMAKVIPLKYKEYYYIEDNDGRETVVINVQSYDRDILDKTVIELLQNNSISNDEKIMKLKKFFNM